MKYATVEEATRAWVSEFNSIPQSFIQRAFKDGYIFDEVQILCTDLVCSECGNTDIEESGNDAGMGWCDVCDRKQEVYDVSDLPMWSTMFTFGSSIDDEWARRNVDKLRACGIWAYEDEDLGLFFGINGAGYDFYESHWIPLYKARGLRWHEKEE